MLGRSVQILIGGGIEDIVSVLLSGSVVADLPLLHPKIETGPYKYGSFNFSALHWGAEHIEAHVLLTDYSPYHASTSGAQVSSTPASENTALANIRVHTYIQETNNKKKKEKNKKGTNISNVQIRLLPF